MKNTFLKIIGFIRKIAAILLIIIGALVLCFIMDYILLFYSSGYLQSVYFKYKPRTVIRGTIQRSNNFHRRNIYIVGLNRCYLVKKINEDERQKLYEMKEGEMVIVLGKVFKAKKTDPFEQFCTKKYIIFIEEIKEKRLQ